MTTIDERTEWLEADGLGGFASGTATLTRTRRYHALLLVATSPPTGRMVLVNGCDAFLTTPAGRWALSTQRYVPNVLHPDGHGRIASFTAEPWPTWEFETPDGYRVRHEIVVEHGTGRTLATWRPTRGDGLSTLEVRPFMSGRDYHATHHQNDAFNFAPLQLGPTLVWRPYDGSPPCTSRRTGLIRISLSGIAISCTPRRRSADSTTVRILRVRESSAGS